jgi:hypothetical protein
MQVTKEHADKLARAIESSGLAQPVSATHRIIVIS